MAVFGDMGAFQQFQQFSLSLHVFTLFLIMFWHWNCRTAVAPTSGWESSVERPMIITAHGLEKTDRGSQGCSGEGSQCGNNIRYHDWIGEL